ncbi:MAG: penicillin-binding protein 1B [Marinagarivorans sp.]
MTRRRAKPSDAQPSASRRWLRHILISLFSLGLVAGAALAAVLWVWSLELEKEVTAKFEGKKWALPARVYARPLELYEGMSLSSQMLDDQLAVLGYRAKDVVTDAGQFNKAAKGKKGTDSSYTLYSRGFEFADKSDAPQAFKLEIAGNKVTVLTDTTGNPLPLVRLEPEEIGGIYPSQMEDRLLVKIDQIPKLLGEGLIATEDKAFMEHHGVSPMAIIRALWVNLTSGQVVQGGSTLTQQLVKNFYLSNERSLKRKAREAIMALLLEKHYSKSAIFETYINEVYLGQSGAREIHGFALAAKHYFRQPLNELNAGQIAYLIGLCKGASYYNPWNHPQRALERRDVILHVMAKEGLLSPDELKAQLDKPLGVLPPTDNSLQTFPAFVDLVKRQLQQEYKIEDLRSEGLKVFTTLSSVLQRQAEASLVDKTHSLEKKFKQDLQSAMVVTSVGTAEVLALIGDQAPHTEGFNRALDSRRSIGSLMKPFVYLTALERPEEYNLGTILSDTPVTYTLDNGQEWSPKNSHGESHGDTPLYAALAHSYNQATVQLGMQLGLPAVIKTLKAAGYHDDIAAVPSLLLGSIDAPPIQMAELYHTLAADGVHAPLRVIQEVIDQEGHPLKRYPLEIQQQFSQEAIFALHHAMYMVFREGTARSVAGLFGNTRLAGKTGTTNDQRDSWFAGFSSDLMAVVWMGRDDNQPTPVSGAGGALQVWADFMAKIPTKGLDEEPPSGMDYYYIDGTTGLLSERGCPGALYLPLRLEQVPTETAGCGGGLLDRLLPSAAPAPGTPQAPGAPGTAPSPASPNPPAKPSFFKRLFQG